MRPDVSERFFLGLGLQAESPELEPGEKIPDLGAGSTQRDSSLDGSGAVVITVADVESERVSWLWPGWLPFGKLVSLAGDPGLGKSTVALDLAARISTGDPMPDGSTIEQARDVLILSAEDSLADVIRPRLEAAGADLGRVHVLPAVRDEEGELRPPTLPDDVSRIEEAAERREVGLIIVDPLSAFLGGSIDSHKDHDVRRALAPLSMLAESTGACVLVIRHWGKSAGKSIYRGLGSIAFIGAARVGVVVAEDPDPEHEGRRVIAVEKSNLAAKPEPLAYHLVSADEHGCARISWAGPVSYSPDELAAPRADSDRSKTEEAVAFLLNRLEDAPAASKGVKADARTQGIGERPLRSARERVGVIVEKRGFPSETFWSLAENAQHSRDMTDVTTGDVTTGHDCGTPYGYPSSGASRAVRGPSRDISGNGHDWGWNVPKNGPPTHDDGSLLAAGVLVDPEEPEDHDLCF